MVDELECEYFSRKNGTLSDDRNQAVFRNPKDLVVSDSASNEDLLSYQMIRGLDQLEKQIFQKYKNFEDYKFVLERIRKAIKEKNTVAFVHQLDDLEELLELELTRM